MPDDLTLVLDRFIDASPENVWRCWVEPELFKLWFAPKPVVIPFVAIDVTPGGRFDLTMEVPGMGAMESQGSVVFVETARRLVTTNALLEGFRPAPPMTGDDFAFTTDVNFTPENGGCRYIAKAMHSLPAHKAAHEAMGFHDGWGTAATQLADLATSF